MQTAAIALIVVLLVGMACGLEITWALGLSCIAAVLLDPKLTFVVIAQRIFANSNSFSMLAIPAFMLAGDVMSKGGLSKRLVAFADSLVGWISGGISLVSIVACTFFAAISGSSVATTAAIGGLSTRDGKARLSGILCGSCSGDRRNTWNRNSAEYRARYLR